MLRSITITYQVLDLIWPPGLISTVSPLVCVEESEILHGAVLSREYSSLAQYYILFCQSMPSTDLKDQ